MATPIKAVPILTGALADDFIRQAEENEHRPRHIFSEEKEKKIAEIMRFSHDMDLPNNPKRHLNKAIAYNKQGRTYPAVLIGRLGVDRDYQGAQFRIGAQIMDFSS